MIQELTSCPFEMDLTFVKVQVADMACGLWSPPPPQISHKLEAKKPEP